MKEITEKPSGRVPKEKAAGNIPKAALKKAWTEAKEKRNVPMEKLDGSDEQGAYSEADQAGKNITDRTTAAISDNLDFSDKRGRQLAQKQYEKRKRQHAAEWAAEEHAHTATERRVSPESTVDGKLPDGRNPAQRGADLPHKCAKEKATTIKTAPHDIRGASHEQKQARTVANEAVRNITGRERLQNSAQQIKIDLQSRAAAIQQKTKATL